VDSETCFNSIQTTELPQLTISPFLRSIQSPAGAGNDLNFLINYSKHFIAKLSITVDRLKQEIQKIASKHSFCGRMTL